MEKYLVSVIIPVYNGSDYVASAIQSVLDQTYQNFEILVINDGSKDDGLTKKAVEPFLTDPRVKYYEKENGGVSSVLDMGIELFNGDFFNWLSHDDMFGPRSLELRVKKWISLGEDNKYIISTDTRYINEQGKKKFRIAARSKNINNIYDIVSSTINGCSLLIPKDAIKGHQFKVGMVYMPDYYLWAEFISEGRRIKLVNKKITYNRVHSKQITQTKFDLLIKDFDEFEEKFIYPLVEQKEYRQLKKMVFAFTRRLSVRPFYDKYISKYKGILVEHKKWNIFDSLHVLFDKCVSLMVKILRRIK